MTRPNSDVLIVGAGPAGSALAAELAGAGFQVTVLERSAHPRPKPCGELLNPGALRALDRLGLLDAVRELGPAALQGWRLRTEGAPEAVGRYGDLGPGLSVARSRLDRLLADHARSRGARVEEGVQVREVEPGDGETGWPAGHTIEADGSRGRRTARVLVGADGLGSIVGRALDTDRPAPGLRKVSLTAHLRGRLERSDLGVLHLTERCTVGVAPITADGELWNATVVVPVGEAGPELSDDPAAFHARCVAEAGLGWTDGFEQVAGPWASGPFDRPSHRIVGPGWLLVGDAAGYYDPLTGQGVQRALQGALAAAGVLTSALRGTEGVPGVPALSGYPKALGRRNRPGRRVQRAIEWVLTRPRVRTRVFRGLARHPEGADRLIRVTGDAAPVRTLIHPSVVLALTGGLPRRGAPHRVTESRWSEVR